MNGLLYLGKVINILIWYRWGGGGVACAILWVIEGDVFLVCCGSVARVDKVV